MMQGEYRWRNSGCGTEDISGMGFSARLVSHDLPSVVLNKPQPWAAPDSSPCLIRPVSAPKPGPRFLSAFAPCGQPCLK